MKLQNKKNSLVTIIVVNWNGRHLLQNCLGSLSKINYKNTEIIFVDNASKDNSVEFVRKNYPHISILLNKTNLGYAEGHEEALKKAKGEFILLLSTDTHVGKNLLDELVHAIQQSKVGAVMPKLVMYPNTKLIDSIGSLFLFSGMLYHVGREKDTNITAYNKCMSIYSAKGACLLFRKEVLKKTGLFDKDYFAYFEETDLCHRVWLAGYSVIYTPLTTVWHIGAGVSGKMAPAFIQFHSFKNRICTYIKNFSLGNLVRVLIGTFILYQVTFVAYLIKGKPLLAFSVQRAIYWNIIHLNETLKKREKIQKNIRKVTDEEYLSKVMGKVRWSYYYYMFWGLKYYKD